MKKPDLSASELIASPMTHVALKLPQVLLERIDQAAVADDSSVPNRSSIMRRLLIAGLRHSREAA